MAEPAAANPERNHLLATLSRPDRVRFLPGVEYVSLERYAFLERPGEEIEHVYFRLSGLGSVVAVGSRARDQRIGAGIFGRDGMSGLPILLGAARSPHEVYVQIPCEALRMTARDLKSLLDLPDFKDLLLR